MLLPMFSLVVFTLIIALIMLVARINAVKSKQISIKFFAVYQGDSPEKLQQLSRHFTNLFETPVLFYTVATLAIVLNQQSSLMITLAWVYVLCRIVHGAIHITYNNIIHRMLAFLSGVVCLAALWINLVLTSL